MKIDRKELQRKYGFRDWHLIEAEEKPYVEAIVRFLIEHIKQDNAKIIECGCGLCDILGDKRLSKFQRIGIDMDERLIAACKEIYRGENITFRLERLGDIEGETADVLVAVNFLHEIADEKVKELIKKLFTKNMIQIFLADEVTGNYPHCHILREIIPEEYQLLEKLGPYTSDGGERYIQVYKKSE